MPKVSTYKDYSDALATFHWYTIYVATKNEASRQVAEMKKWKYYQERYDPEGMLFEYEDQLFERISLADKYRGRIYYRNKAAKKAGIDFGIAETEFNKTGDPEHKKAMEEVFAVYAEIQNEQMALATKILKIYCSVKEELNKLAGDGTGSDVLDNYEYEYDLE